MMFYLALIFLIAGLGMFLSDPFMTYQRTAVLGFWAFVGALVCGGIGIGQLL